MVCGRLLHSNTASHRTLLEELVIMQLVNNTVIIFFLANPRTEVPLHFLLSSLRRLCYRVRARTLSAQMS